MIATLSEKPFDATYPLLQQECVSDFTALMVAHSHVKYYD
jgi:hypothetical protein